MGGVCVQQPWFQVFADLPGHKKIGKLRDALGLKNRYEAVGLIVCIWSWAAVHAPSGQLEDITAQDLADAAGWRKSAKKLMEALVASGLIDQTEEGHSLHDWDGHQCMLQDAMTRSRRKAADRQKAYRERKKAEAQGALALPPPVPEDDAARNAMRNVTGNVTERHRNGTTSSSTITNTLPISEVVAVGNTVHTDGGDGTDRDVLKLIGGEVGQGVLLLTDRQMDDLLERLGVDGFNAYGKRLVSWVQRKGANVDHYREILKWAKEDGALNDGPELLWAGRVGT